MIALRGNDDPPEEVSKKSTCATNAAVIDVRCSLGRSQLSVTTLSISFILKVPSAFTHPALYLFPPPFDSVDWFPSCARPPFSINARVCWLFALMFFWHFAFLYLFWSVSLFGTFRHVLLSRLMHDNNPVSDPWFCSDRACGILG